MGILDAPVTPARIGAVARAGGTAPGAAALSYYNVSDYGLVADSGVTDNAPLLTTLLAAIPAGSAVVFPTNGTSYYAFGSTVTLNKAVTLLGNWGQETSAVAPVGSILRPTSAAAFGAATPLLRVTTGRVKIHGLVIRGRFVKDSAATTDGTVTVTLSGAVAAATWMIGCPVSGTDVPLSASSITTVTAVDTGANTITLSSAATGTHTGTASISIWAGQGVTFGANSHQSKIFDCHISQFAVGLNNGTGSDHITAHSCEIAGNYDNVLFDNGNLFDYAFFDCNLTGAAHASARLFGPNTSTQNLLFSRTHLGFSPYGLVQDATASGDGYAGVRFVGSPIESITRQHICIVNGGSITVDPSCYWGWDNTDVEKPALTAFQITGLQDFGPIDFQAQLLANHPNPNCPQIISVGNQNGFPIDVHNIALNGFALNRLPFTSYTGLVQGASVYLNGDSTNTGNNSKLNVGGSLNAHSTSKTAAYSTAASDFMIRCTANSFTLTLTQRTANQIIFVTNEGAGTITMAVSAGSYIGPATIAGGHSAIFVSDGTNWRCMGSY